MRRIKSIWVYSLFIFLMSLVVILSWDDFFWGGSKGLNQLMTYFEGYNGRYIGNMIEIIITRYKLARVLIYTVVNIGIALFMLKLIGREIRGRYVVLILLTLPIGIVSQTYGWLAGFANYNVSALLVLMLFYFIFKAKYQWWQIIIILFLGFFVQFFAENITIVTIIISCFALLYHFFLSKDKNKLLLSFLWLISSIGGYIIMFQNSAYHSDSARGLSNIYLSELYKHVIQDWSELVIKENVFLMFLFSIVIYFILNKPKIIGSYLLFFNVYFIIRNYLNVTYNQLPLYILIGELLLIVAFFVLLIYVGIVSLKEERDLYFIFLFSAILMVAPFVVVTPFGPRNILLSYLMLAISLGYLFKKLEMNDNNIKLIDGFVKQLIVCLSVVILGLYAVNYLENNRRLAVIYKANNHNDESIEIRQLPFSFLGQNLDSINPGSRADEFKEYYNVSSDVEIKVISRKMPLPWLQTND